MDNMVITSKFMTNLVGKVVKKALSKQLGFDVDLRLRAIDISLDEKTANVHLNASVSTDRKNFEEIAAKYLDLE